ncbi:hypothetical protein [Clostridium tyrobutyricum]|uniref:hypothetical protein n=1 Tax=Clostridium tyrobutyricum TaxID=1519 RepID=UPI0005808ECA|nr:hypothetical protein [Clostridium tyrobutyricum]
MNNASNLEILLEKVTNNKDSIEEICNIVPDLFNKISSMLDIVEVGGLPVKFLFKAYNGVKIYRFKKFLSSFYKGISNGEIYSQNKILKLKKYMEDKKRIFYINTMLDDALNARSILSSMILGYYAGQLINRQHDVKYIDQIIINSLRNLFDDDINNFKKMMDYLKENELQKAYFTENIIRTLNIQKEDETYSFELMIEKLKNLQILGYGLGGFGMEWGVFSITEVSKHFYKLIKDIQVLKYN